jgi:hypothetical protein
MPDNWLYPHATNLVLKILFLFILATNLLFTHPIPSGIFSYGITSSTSLIFISSNLLQWLPAFLLFIKFRMIIGFMKLCRLFRIVFNEERNIVSLPEFKPFIVLDDSELNQLFQPIICCGISGCKDLSLFLDQTFYQNHHHQQDN